MNPAVIKRVFPLLLLVCSLIIAGAPVDQTKAISNNTLPHQSITIWEPYLEWEIANSSYSDNPFDIIATVTFTHDASGEQIETEMFYDGGDAWKFRFTGTKTGDWAFVTDSDDSDLDGQTGTLTVTSGGDRLGFVSNEDEKWIRTNGDNAFVPQFVMVSGPQNYANNAARIDEEIQTFIGEHGFNGFHTPVLCRWFEIDEPVCDNISGSDPNPDLDTFRVLETMITKVYDADGVVHIWMWGDSYRKQNPNFLPGGVNGPVDNRLQRYIAARLGPLPGWTMGYGFDLYEWSSDSELTEWHDHMQARLGWKHYLGGRSNPNPPISQISEALDYSGYEQLKPQYADYVDAIEDRPSKPSFSEDRFRVQTDSPYPERNWSMLEVRHALWRSMMAGGVANIWGNLVGDRGANDGSDTSQPFPNPEWIKTYSTFSNGRFFSDMERCNNLTNGGLCLKRANDADYIFYAEDTASITLNLSGMAEAQPAIAVDTTEDYAEITLGLGQLDPINQMWTAPYESDWAIAVGDFQDAADENQPPTASDETFLTVANQPATMQLDYTDPDNGPGPYSINITSNPNHGSLSGTGSERVYTPATDFVGTDQFSWQVHDGEAHSSQVQYTIHVRELPSDFLFLPMTIKQ